MAIGEGDGAESGRARMHQIELLVEAYLMAERELVAAVDSKALAD